MPVHFELPAENGQREVILSSLHWMFFTTLIWFRIVYKISSCCWFCIHFWIKWDLRKTFDAKMIGWTHFSTNENDSKNKLLSSWKWILGHFAEMSEEGSTYRFLADQLDLFQLGAQIMPTTLLLATGPPDFWTIHTHFQKPTVSGGLRNENRKKKYTIYY